MYVTGKAHAEHFNELYMRGCPNLFKLVYRDQGTGMTLLEARSGVYFFQGGKPDHCVPVGPKNENFNSGRSVLALKIIFP